MPSGLILPERAAEAELRKLQRPKAMDFFAGAGGFSLGIIQAGFEVVAMSEFDCAATHTYMANLCRWGEVKVHMVTKEDGDRFERYMTNVFKNAGVKIVDGEIVQSGKVDIKPMPMAGSGWIKNQPRNLKGVSHIFFGDCRKLTADRILDEIGMKRGELDLVVGGPPCQGYSTAGKRDVYDARNSLVFEYARFVVDLRPKAMAMEEVPNVLNMVTPDGQPVIDQLIRILEDGGFGGYNAFRKALEAQTGAFGLLRGGGTGADRKKRGREDSASDEQDETSGEPVMPVQTDLFGEAA